MVARTNRLGCDFEDYAYTAASATEFSGAVEVSFFVENYTRVGIGPVISREVMQYAVLPFAACGRRQLEHHAAAGLALTGSATRGAIQISGGIEGERARHTAALGLGEVVNDTFLPAVGTVGQLEYDAAIDAAALDGRPIKISRLIHDEAGKQAQAIPIVAGEVVQHLVLPGAVRLVFQFVRCAPVAALASAAEFGSAIEVP